jgi:putative membrane protein
MHVMTGWLGQIGILAALVLQRGPDSLERGDHLGGLWEPEILLLILFLGGLVAVVTWLVVRLFPTVRGDERPEAPRDSAEEILRERFARGEISAEEFQRAIEILRDATIRRVRSGDHEDG